MNKINPLFEAMSSIDDNIVTNARRPRKRPTALIFTVVAASVLLLTGAAVVARSAARLSNGSLVDYNFYAQKGMVFPSPNELREMGAVNDTEADGLYNINALPSEVFEKFNLDIPVNKNFAYSPADIKMWLSEFDDGTKEVEFNYLLTDKAMNVKIQFSVTATDGEAPSFDFEIRGTERAKTKFVTLKDGSEALIFQRIQKIAGMEDLADDPGAEFSYNGIIYSLSIRSDLSNNDDAYTVDDMEQVLKDLGVL